MKRSGLNIVNAAFFLIIAAGNLISCISYHDPWWKLIAYTAPLFTAAAVAFFYRMKITPKVTACLFITFSVMSIIFGDHGNQTGAIFLCFAIYVFASTRISIIAGVATALTILGKSVFSSWTAPQIINYIAAYSYILAVYWILIHPKSPKISPGSLDYETIDIVLKFYKGANRAEIADVLNISPSTVTDKMKKARARMNARSDMELFQKLRQKGDISV